MEYIIFGGVFVVVAVIMVFILRMVLSGQSNTAIERLKRINQENLQRELELKKKLDEAETQYKQKMSDASAEIQKIRGKMEGEVSLLKNKIVAAAEREKDAILADARQEAQDLQARLASSMNERIVRFSREMISRIFADSGENDRIISGLHQYFIDQAVLKIKSLETEMLVSALASVSEVKVSTRLALTSEQKRSLLEAFPSVQGGVKIAENSPDPKCLAGISIKIGNLVIDATLNNRLKDIMAGMPLSDSKSEVQ